MDIWTKREKERVGLIERAALTCMCVKQLVGSFYIEQELGLVFCDGLGDGMGEGGRSKGEGTCVYV